MEIFLFVLGTIFASFINALMYRVEGNFPIKKMLFTRSECESCKKELKWYELFPILSYIFQRGRCTKCGKPIDPYYPISEFLLGFGFYIVYSTMPFPVISVFFLTILFALSYSDYKSKEIPQSLTNILVLLGIPFYIISHNSPTSLLILLGIVIFYWLAGMIRKEWKNAVGFGDLLLLVFFALILPMGQFITLLILFSLIAGIFAIAMVALKKGTMKSYIPLLPFMTLAYILTPLFTDILMKYIFQI